MAPQHSIRRPVPFCRHDYESTGKRSGGQKIYQCRGCGKWEMQDALELALGVKRFV